MEYCSFFFKQGVYLNNKMLDLKGKLFQIHFYESNLSLLKDRIQPLDQEDPLEKEMATYSSIFAWEIPLDREAWLVTVHGVTKESDTTYQLNSNSNI